MTSRSGQDGRRTRTLAAPPAAAQPPGGEATEAPRRLRDQQQDLTRELILRSVAEQLDTEEPTEITVPGVAAAAGVSVRTVYRHFASREDLIAAAADWIAEHVGLVVPADRR